MSPESRGPEVHGDGHERQVAGRLGAVGACICPEGRQVRTGRGPPHTAMVLTLSAADVKRSTEPASSAVCGGQIRTARVRTAKAWLDEGVGSLAVLADLCVFFSDVLTYCVMLQAFICYCSYVSCL